MSSRTFVHAAISATALVVCVAGCGSPAASRTSPPLTYEIDRSQRTLEDCPEHLAPCASITLESIVLSDAPDQVRMAVEAFLDTTVFAPIDEREARAGAGMAEALMEEFLAGYREFMERYPDAPGTWSIRRRALPLWNEEGLFSIEFTEESYTGGAHPQTQTSLVTLDTRDGHTVMLEELLIDAFEAPLTELGERAFREAHGLGPADDLMAAGFWFDDGVFRLNRNFVVTGDGLRFHFNAYEVAPYAVGPTDMTLSRADLAAMLRRDGPLSHAAPTRN